METSGDGWAPDTSMQRQTWESFPAEVQKYATDLATHMLWTATGRRFGLHEVTVRPAVPRTLPTYLSFPVSYDPGGMGGQWAWSLVSAPGGNSVVFGGGSFDGPWAGTRAQIPLPGPVDSVSSVTIDGQTLDPTKWRLDQPNLLVRQDGRDWPASQDMTAPLGQANTWSVTYRRGEVVPPIVNYAAGAYAIEIAKARAGGDCRLPQRATSISRQGVNVQLVDVTDYLNKGLTGVQEVDQVIISINPYGLKSQPRVVSLDTPQYR